MKVQSPSGDLLNSGTKIIPEEQNNRQDQVQEIKSFTKGESKTGNITAGTWRKPRQSGRG